MSQSPTIGALAGALAKAQAELQPANKDKNNTFLGSRYASLGAVIEAICEAATKHGLSFTQLPTSDGRTITVETILLHESGEWITSSLTMPLGEMKGLALVQSAGILITYLRRYALAAMFGVYADEDTDGNDSHTETTGASKTTGTTERKPAATQTTTSANADAPTCPKCKGPMWDNRKKVAEGGKGPEWSCKAGKWNAETKQTDGCDGKLWKGEWPPREKPSDDIVKNIITLAQDLYGKATGATMKDWLEKGFEIVNPKSLKDGIEHLTPDQADGMYAGLLAEQDKRYAEMNASGAEVGTWGTDAEK